MHYQGAKVNILFEKHKFSVDYFCFIAQGIVDRFSVRELLIDSQSVLSTSTVDIFHDFTGVVLIVDSRLRTQPEHELHTTTCLCGLCLTHKHRFLANHLRMIQEPLFNMLPELSDIGFWKEPSTNV